MGLYCGARLFRLSDWRVYGVFRKLNDKWFFSIGPVLFWDGS
jgi:hypothetical protein